MFHLFLTGFSVRRLKTSFGTISSPLYPNNYETYQNCGWIIEVAKRKIIKLNFSHFDTQSNHDVVQVYDGETLASPLLGSLRGPNNPGVFFSNGTKMLIIFTSDGAVNRNGFSASYTSGKILCFFSKSNYITLFNTFIQI